MGRWQATVTKKSSMSNLGCTMSRVLPNCVSRWVQAFAGVRIHPLRRMQRPSFLDGGTPRRFIAKEALNKSPMVSKWWLFGYKSAGENYKHLFIQRFLSVCHRNRRRAWCRAGQVLYGGFRERSFLVSLPRGHAQVAMKQMKGRAYARVWSSQRKE